MYIIIEYSLQINRSAVIRRLGNYHSKNNSNINNNNKRREENTDRYDIIMMFMRFDYIVNI